MGPSGYTVKLEQWEEEDRQLAEAGIPNPYDAYPDDRSKNWIRARSKLVIKDRVAVIVFNNKEAEKLATNIKEKIACAESSGMAGQREYDVLSQCLGRPEQHGRVWCLQLPGLEVCMASTCRDVHEEEEDKDRHIS
jgi:hypothetical protein